MRFTVPLFYTDPTPSYTEPQADPVLNPNFKTDPDGVDPSSHQVEHLAAKCSVTHVGGAVWIAPQIYSDATCEG